jgi:hypothetical protein
MTSDMTLVVELGFLTMLLFFSFAITDARVMRFELEDDGAEAFPPSPESFAFLFVVGVFTVCCFLFGGIVVDTRKRCF